MAQADQPAKTHQHSSKTILVVEDDAEIGEFLLAALTMEVRYHVLLAENGALALELIKTVLPDLFLLDYHLPGINGLELAQQLSSNPAFASIPILLMSANLPRGQLRDLPITCIEKPFELDELFRIIERLVTHGHSPTTGNAEEKGLNENESADLLDRQADPPSHNCN